MHIREAMPEDNEELQELQAKCPQGTTLIVSVVNTPDFFARAKAYESYNVYVACENNRIIGSAACAIRDAVVQGSICQVGHQFQLFVSPEYRRKGVASKLHQYREDYLTQQGVVLSYALIIEGNVPSMRYALRQGFKLHRTLVMPGRQHTALTTCSSWRIRVRSWPVWASGIGARLCGSPLKPSA